MKVKVVFLNNELGKFVIKANTQQFVVDPVSTQISIDLFNNKENEIEIIEQQQDKSTLLAWIIWLFTLPLHGLINAIISYGDDVWHKQVNPYLLSAKLSFPTLESSIIYISFASREHKQWVCTTIECEQAKYIMIDYQPYPDAIYESYFGYVKKIVSISSIGVLLFTFLLCEMLVGGNTIGVLICISLIIFIVVLNVLQITIQYFKAKKLYTTFDRT